jgi:hypothetical protein
MQPAPGAGALLRQTVAIAYDSPAPYEGGVVSDAVRSAVEELSARRLPQARLLSAARGCLLGGALGDALGASAAHENRRRADDPS